MEPSKVYYVSARATKWSYRESLAGRFETLLKEFQVGKYLKKKDPVALKMHFGSEGAHRIIRPLFVRKVVETVRRAGGKPFVTDTVRIKGLDYLKVANENGINEQACGAPVILADGIFGNDHVSVPSGSEQGEVFVASALHDAPSMIVLSHFKGHVNAGIGGAIKNLAMGGLSGSDRNHDWKHGRGGMHTHHTAGKIEWEREQCSLCNQCVEICPLDACSFENELWEYNAKKCWRCGRCARVCPEGALDMPMDEDRFHQGMAESTKAVLSTFKEHRVLYINFLLEIQPECDCMPGADVPVVQDLGILLSDDIVAIDQASCDLILQNPPLPGSMAEDRGLKPGDDIMLKLHRIDGRKHIDAACALGLGNKEYSLIKT
ncbi:MAG: DUF362 domain-containing protein [Deltaproteobacteria bacterium]|nr:DUF362 domain-containing protein [Deltaproteobacteria bacterium]